jgi:hypothetical protein
MATLGVSPYRRGWQPRSIADFVPRVTEKLPEWRRNHCLWAEDRGR